MVLLAVVLKLIRHTYFDIASLVFTHSSILFDILPYAFSTDMVGDSDEPYVEDDIATGYVMS